MPYVGNKPVNNFVSFAKQNITGNGGTSYSLDYAVTNANDIELFINNVRQEPTEAYSASGSTLTLTGAISSTDDVYVIFRGRALQTAQHPADSALEASQATISGNLSATGAGNIGGTLDVGGDFTITGGNMVTSKINSTSYQNHLVMQTTYNSTDYTWTITNEGNTGRLRFMSNDGTSTKFPMYMYSDTGIVTQPAKPAFHVSGVGQSTNAHLANWSNVNLNTGSHFNNTNGRFTAPVSGVYYFFFFFTAQDQSAPVYPRLDKNGSKWTPSSMDALHADSGATADFGDDQSNSGLFFMSSLSAGDYVNAYVINASTYYTNGIVFGGYLLG